MAQDVARVATAPRGLTTADDRLLTLDPSGALVVIDWMAKAILDGYGFQVRAGTVTTPLVGDVVITDTAAEFCVDIANGGTLIPMTQYVSIRLGTGTLFEFATKSVSGASSAGTAFVPLPMKNGGAAAALSTARVQAAGAVTVTAELATTTLRHWSFSQPIAMGAYVTDSLWQPLRPPMLVGTAAAARCLYTQVAATTTGPSYYANIDYLEIPTALMGR